MFYVTTTLVWETQPIGKQQNKEKTVGLVFGGEDVMFFLPSSKPEAMEPNHVPMRPFQPLLASNKLDRLVHCGSMQPQTALYVSCVKHLLGYASTADCICNKQRTKQMFVGCRGEKTDEADSRVTSCKLEVALRNSLC